MSEQPKDTLIKFRATIAGKNSKGGDRFQLYLTPEEATSLADELTGKNTSEKGVKIDLHITKRETEEGRSFLASFGFVKTTQDSTTGMQAVAKKNFVTRDERDEKAAKLKKELA